MIEPPEITYLGRIAFSRNIPVLHNGKFDSNEWEKNAEILCHPIESKYYIRNVESIIRTWKYLLFNLSARNVIRQFYRSSVFSKDNKTLFIFLKEEKSTMCRINLKVLTYLDNYTTGKIQNQYKHLIKLAFHRRLSKSSAHNSNKGISTHLI